MKKIGILKLSSFDMWLINHILKLSLNISEEEKLNDPTWNKDDQLMIEKVQLLQLKIENSINDEIPYEENK